jgi:hypothetical protein
VRFATPLEDCGCQKADIVLNYDSNIYYLQVSKQPKSQKELLNLESRGTYAVHTPKYHDMPLSDNDLTNIIKKILGAK